MRTGHDHLQPRYPERIIPGVGTLVHKPLDINDRLLTSENSHKVMRATGIYLQLPETQVLLGLVGPINVLFNFVQRQGYTDNDQRWGVPVDGRRQTRADVLRKFEADIATTDYLTQRGTEHEGFWPFPRLTSVNRSREFTFTIESIPMSDTFDKMGQMLSKPEFRLADSEKTDRQYKLLLQLIHVRNTKRNLELLHLLGVAHNDFGFRNVMTQGHQTFLIDFGNSKIFNPGEEVNSTLDKSYFGSECAQFDVLATTLLGPQASLATPQEKIDRLAALNSIDIDQVLQPLLAEVGVSEEQIGELYEQERIRYKVLNASNGIINLSSPAIEQIREEAIELEKAA